jgi:hypothetical protein
MHHTLKHLAHATPTWLANLSPTDIEKGPYPWMKHLVEDALVYPGSGLDGSPVRQCNGALHSFIYLDYGTPKAEVLAALTKQRKTGTGFAHHHLIGLVEFNATNLIAKADPRFIHRRSKENGAKSPFAIWAVYETNDPGPAERFSFLFLSAEAIQSLAALFPASAPRGLVVQEHGFSGNCWSNFSEPILRLSEKWSGQPEILILGQNHRLDQWSRNALSKGTDAAIESMHRDTREVLWMNNLDSMAFVRKDLAHA